MNNELTGRGQAIGADDLNFYESWKNVHRMSVKLPNRTYR